MTTVSKNAVASEDASFQGQGGGNPSWLLYALPDWLMIIMLFFVPIVLLVIMAVPAGR